jgi:hypothetical protein
MIAIELVTTILKPKNGKLQSPPTYNFAFRYAFDFGLFFTVSKEYS